MAAQTRYATAKDIAAYVTEHHFPISERGIRRDWRVRYGLRFVMIAGRSVASLAEAEKIAKQLKQTAQDAPASFGGRAA